MLQQPFDLRAREVRVEDEARALAHQRLVAGLPQLVAARRGPPVLPDERAVQRLAGLGIPRAHRLALVGDADRAQLARADARVVQCLHGHRLRHVPDLRRVVLDPSGPREVLLELAVGAPDQLGLVVEDEAGRARRALVDGEDHAGARLSSCTVPRPGPSIVAVLAAAAALALSGPAPAVAAVPRGFIGVTTSPPLLVPVFASTTRPAGCARRASSRFAPRWTGATCSRIAMWRRRRPTSSMRSTSSTECRPTSATMTRSSVPRRNGGWRCCPLSSGRRVGWAGRPPTRRPRAAPTRACCARSWAATAHAAPCGPRTRGSPGGRSATGRSGTSTTSSNGGRGSRTRPGSCGCCAPRARRSGGADPRARIVLGGLPNFSWRELARIYRAGGRGTFDVVAIHPFTLKGNNVVRIARLIRGVARRNHQPHLPIWVTELSWPAARGKTSFNFHFDGSPALQAARIRGTIPALARQRRTLGVERIFWETWMTEYKNRRAPFDYTGLRKVALSARLETGDRPQHAGAHGLRPHRAAAGGLPSPDWQALPLERPIRRPGHPLARPGRLLAGHTNHGAWVERAAADGQCAGYVRREPAPTDRRSKPAPTGGRDRPARSP